MKDYKLTMWLLRMLARLGFVSEGDVFMTKEAYEELINEIDSYKELCNQYKELCNQYKESIDNYLNSTPTEEEVAKLLEITVEELREGYTANN